MTGLTRAWPVVLATFVVVTPAAAQGPGEPGADSLRLAEVLARVSEGNPRIQAMRAGAEAAAFRRPEAGTLPDPMMQIGIMNVGLPELNADMPSSMAPSVQLMQMLPFPGKLGLKAEIAELDEAMARTAVDEMAWDLRAMAAEMFYGLYALDGRTRVMEETLDLLTDFRQVANAMYVSGMGRQSDVLRADVEVARMDGEIRSMRAMRTGMAARLNALMDAPADAPVAPPALGRLPDAPPPGDSLVAWADASRPLLIQGRQAVDQAGSRVALARRELWPDLTVGVAYGQRGSEMGTERMGSAMVGFSLPVWASRRQHAMRDEAMAMERMATASLGDREAQVAAEIQAHLAEADRTRGLVALYRDEILPQARATVSSALSSYRVGAVDFMTLVDAQMGVNRYEMELVQLLADYGTALAALESAVGRPLSFDEPSLLEAR